MFLNDFMHRLMKRMVQVVIPATAALYFGLSQIWGLPWMQEVGGTLAIIATFFGTVLSISTSNYNKSDAAYDGTVVVEETKTGGKLFSLELNGDPSDIEVMTSVRFKVANGNTLPKSHK